MHTAEVYALLAAELASAQQQPAEALSALADGGRQVREVDMGGSPVSIELVATWLDRGRTGLRITATAQGASSYRLQRISESVLHVLPP